MKNTTTVKKTSRWRSFTRQEKILLPIFMFCIFIFVIKSMLPICYAIMNSVKSIEQFNISAVEFPNSFEIGNFKKALGLVYRNTTLVQMFGYTCIFVVTYLGGSMMSSLMAAYILSRFRFIGRNFIYSVAVVKQFIPIFGTAGKAFMLLTDLGMIDNYWTIWISGAGGFDYAFLIIYSYFENVDRAYAESAKMDGAGNLTIFFRIMIPLVWPSILVMGLSETIKLYNDYGTSLIYIPNKPTLANGIYALENMSSRQEGGLVVYFAAIVLSVIPVTILYSFSQNSIFKISLDGGVKG